MTNRRRNSRDNTRTGKKNPGVARNPAGAVEREPAAGDDATQIAGDALKLDPRHAQDGEEADLRAQVLRDRGGYGAQGFGGGPEEDVVASPPCSGKAIAAILSAHCDDDVSCTRCRAVLPDDVRSTLRAPA